MGSSASQAVEPVKVAASSEATFSAQPAPLSAAGEQTPSAAELGFRNCWSCRLLSGVGLIGAGGYVYWVARKPMKMGYAPSPGTIAQMVVGISIACWGVVILTDPKGKAYRTV
ncbi:distal membrane-arm assembly complex protein 1 [Sorex araneus]|uniref:distal membrane-arm assembly complex protein 1 n=1 Tax=Sorex araneus TaxID=42254 RepID=UPI002433FCCC|nr:distal membrane-arm assembly complex protein 1 [Sorex araneus]